LASRLDAATVDLGAAAQQQGFAEAPFQAHLGHALAADEAGAQSRELALAAVRELAVQRLGDDHADDRIAQELQLFVVATRGVALVALVRMGGQNGLGRRAVPRFVGEGPVREREIQQRGFCKGVAEALLEHLA
jgi:hypothetical protein